MAVGFIAGHDYFLHFLGAGPSRVGGGGGRAINDFGTIYGRKLTLQDYVEGRNEYFLFYRVHYNQWPDKNPNLSRTDLEREIYIHILFNLKAADLGIHISDDVVEQTAAEMFRSFGRNGQPVPMDASSNNFPSRKA